MASSPITSWQIDGETMETVADITLPTKVWIVIAVVFFRSHVWRWELYHKGWTPKNWCFGIVFLKKTLESPLDRKIKPINPKWNQPWIFIGRTETEAPILWPPDVKSQLIGKDHDAGKDWGQEKVGDTGWDDWMVSLTQWTWVWARSRSWWWTGKSGVLQFMGLQKVRHDWETELNWW